MNTLNPADVSGNPMELWMESDEEEASLLEEMEQQETNTVFKPTGVLNSETSNMLIFGGLQPKENSELYKVNNSLQACVNESATNLPENGQLLENIQQNILQRLYSKIPIEQEPPDIATEDRIGEAQILQLDISENDLIAAKSAFALQSQNEILATPGTSLTPHFMNLDGVSGGLELREHAIFGQNIMGLPYTNNNGKEKISKPKKRSYIKRSRGTQVKKSINGSTHPNRMKKIPLKTLPPENSVWQLRDTQVRVRKQDASNGTAKSIQGSTEVLPRDKCSRSPEVNFCCHFCKLKYPLKKDNIPDIIKHMNPPDRYNQILKIPERLSSFRENIKLSVLVAKDKSKAQVRLVSRVECSSCNHQHICNIENSEDIVVHSHWCQKMDCFNGKRALCLFCNVAVPIGCLRKHLRCRSKRRCEKVDILTLQLMSSVCENYVQQHKPICIVCNEKEWPYKGHRSELEPVCESCRFNITSGNTTRLVHRDVTGCAICGLHCADKFVTYWASEMESLFIGESCIEKLKNPEPKPSEEITALKAMKLNTLLETALSSVTVQDSSENDHNTPRLAPNILSRYEDTVSNFSSHSQVEDRKRKAITNRNLSVNSLNQGKVKGKFLPITESFKISNSDTPLPFANLLPKSLFNDSKKSEEKMATKNTLSVTDVKANAPVANSKDLEGQLDAESSWTPKVGGAEQCETKNTVIKFQENVPHSTCGTTKQYPLIAYCKKIVKVDTLQQPTSEDSNFTFKIITRAGSKSETNTLPAASSTQPSVTLNSGSCSSIAASRAVLGVATEAQKPKYVIKYATAPGANSSDGIANVDKEHIVIKTSSGTTLASSIVKSPRLGKIIKTNMIVCGDAWDETKICVENKHKKQIIPNKKTPSIVLLD